MARIILAVACVLIQLSCCILRAQSGPESAPDGGVALKPAALVRDIAGKVGTAKQYAFEGELQVTRKVAGDDPGEILAQAKVKVAVAAGGKYHLDIDEDGKSPYTFISDGQKRWAYVPTLKRYTEGQAADTLTVGDTDTDPLQLSEPEIISRVCRLAVPTLVRLAQSAENVYDNGPILTVLPPKSDHSRNEEILYLTVDPDQLKLRRMIWMTSASSKEEKILIRSAIVFQDLRVNEAIPDSEFVFSPPKNTKRTESLSIPAQRRSKHTTPR